MADGDHVVAVGLLTEAGLAKLGESFRNWYPVDDASCFGDLLHAIDDADGAMIEHRGAAPELR